mmetsp:Transcript_12349/g.16975  ORF Transcript_12349/g.16975 Transcript_12349/m.16975 type:complete len:229 (+) Transcript_12349:307-993(+)
MRASATSAQRRVAASPSSQGRPGPVSRTVTSNWPLCNFWGGIKTLTGCEIEGTQVRSQSSHNRMERMHGCGNCSIENSASIGYVARSSSCRERVASLLPPRGSGSLNAQEGVVLTGGRGSLRGDGTTNLVPAVALSCGEKYFQIAFTSIVSGTLRVVLENILSVLRPCEPFARTSCFGITHSISLRDSDVTELSSQLSELMVDDCSVIESSHEFLINETGDTLVFLEG